MEQYVEYLRKSRFDRDYADMSTEETLKRHEAILDKLANFVRILCCSLNAARRR